MPAFPLLGFVQNYGWGAKGKESLVAKLHAANSARYEKYHVKKFLIDQDKPHAELWLGDHPNGPNRVALQGSEELETIKNVMKQASGKDAPELSFLLKVLSIEEPLSLQSHPNKADAERLHKSFPETYKDDGQKAEIAIAVSDVFEALIGFRALEEIAVFQKLAPEVGRFLDVADTSVEHNEDATAASYRCLLASNLGATPDEMREIIDKLSVITPEMLYERRNGMNGVGDGVLDSLSAAIGMCVRVSQFFPGDCGVLAPLYLNYVKMSPGQCAYIPADTIHAYMKGTCVECMVNSDNVIRAGLTPKLKDVASLMETLRFGPTAVLDQMLTSSISDSEVSLATYVSPVGDFRVHTLILKPGQSAAALPIPADSAVTLICLSGSGTLIDEGKKTHPLSFGSSYFLPRFEDCSIEASGEAPETNNSLSLSAVMQNDSKAMVVCLASGSIA